MKPIFALCVAQPSQLYSSQSLSTPLSLSLLSLSGTPMMKASVHVVRASRASGWRGNLSRSTVSFFFLLRLPGENTCSAQQNSEKKSREKSRDNHFLQKYETKNQKFPQQRKNYGPKDSRTVFRLFRNLLVGEKGGPHCYFFLPLYIYYYQIRYIHTVYLGICIFFIFCLVK